MCEAVDEPVLENDPAAATAPEQPSDIDHPEQLQKTSPDVQLLVAKQKFESTDDADNHPIPRDTSFIEPIVLNIVQAATQAPTCGEVMTLISLNGETSQECFHGIPKLADAGGSCVEMTTSTGLASAAPTIAGSPGSGIGPDCEQQSQLDEDVIVFRVLNDPPTENLHTQKPSICDFQSNNTDFVHLQLQMDRSVVAAERALPTGELWVPRSMCLHILAERLSGWSAHHGGLYIPPDKLSVTLGLHYSLRLHHNYRVLDDVAPAGVSSLPVFVGCSGMIGGQPQDKKRPGRPPASRKKEKPEPETDSPISTSAVKGVPVALPPMSTSGKCTPSGHELIANTELEEVFFTTLERFDAKLPAERKTAWRQKFQWTTEDEMRSWAHAVSREQKERRTEDFNDLGLKKWEQRRVLTALENVFGTVTSPQHQSLEAHPATAPVEADWRAKHYDVWEMKLCDENVYKITENAIVPIKREQWLEINDIMKKKIQRLPPDFEKYTYVEHLVSDKVENESMLQHGLTPVLHDVCSLRYHYEWVFLKAHHTSHKYRYPDVSVHRYIQIPDQEADKGVPGAAILVEFKTMKDSRTKSNYLKACQIMEPDALYTNLIRACLRYGLAAAGKAHIIHDDDTATPHRSWVVPAEAPAPGSAVQTMTDVAEHQLSAQQQADEMEERLMKKRAREEKVLRRLKSRRPKKAIPAAPTQPDSTVMPNLEEADPVTPPPTISHEASESYLQQIIAYADQYEVAFSDTVTKATTALQETVDWHKLLYLSKAALVRRMMCCESAELASKQAVMGIFVLHNLLASFVMRYNLQDQTFEYVTLVSCCNMRNNRRLHDAFTRLHMVSEMIETNFDNISKLALDKGQADILKIKLKAAAEPIPLKRKYDDDDGANGPAANGASFLSEEEALQEVAKVTGELSGLERVGGNVWRAVNQSGTAISIRISCGLSDTHWVDLLPVLVNIPGFLQPLRTIPLSRGLEHAVVYPWVDGAERWPYNVVDMSARDRCAMWRYMMQTVAAMHDRGITHGDIKPTNFVQPRAQPLQPVLIDHETVRAPRRDPPSFRVTYCYEELGAVDQFAKDRYALGATMAHCLVGYRRTHLDLEFHVDWPQVLHKYRPQCHAVEHRVMDLLLRDYDTPHLSECISLLATVVDDSADTRQKNISAAVAVAKQRRALQPLSANVPGAPLGKRRNTVAHRQYDTENAPLIRK